MISACIGKFGIPLIACSQEAWFLNITDAYGSRKCETVENSRAQIGDRLHGSAVLETCVESICDKIGRHIAIGNNLVAYGKDFCC